MARITRVAQFDHPAPHTWTNVRELNNGGRNGAGGVAGLLTPEDFARQVRLRWINDDEPGIRRKRRRDTFVYLDCDGNKVTDEVTLDRIRLLVLPPAWEDVWISPDPHTHIQATARDARGRKQYRYHERWREVRDAAKFSHLLEFGRALPRIRKRAATDLGLRGLPREKVLAATVQLLELTHIRVGNEEYARTNGSYGLSTLVDDHVEINGSKLHFRFVGKSGKEHDITLGDRRLAKVVRRCQELPGQHLFQYIDDDGVQRRVTSDDVNAYIREISGGDFTAKDFRTWAATVMALECLRKLEPALTEKAKKSNVVAMVKEVAHCLGNTPAVCRKCYIHPRIIEAYAQDLLENGRSRASASPFGLSAEERAVVRLLEAADEVAC